MTIAVDLGCKATKKMKSERYKGEIIVFTSVFYIKWGHMLCKGPFYMFGSPCVILIRLRMTQ